MKPLSAQSALDRHFLEARCLMLDLAAILDRIDRGGTTDDGRQKLFAEALEVLQRPGPGRAEKIQQIFSLAYDSEWEKPQPRY